MTTTESHTPIAVPCEELELILDTLGQGVDLPGDVVLAIERVRGRFPADWRKPTWERAPMPVFPTMRFLLDEICARLESSGLHVEACQVAGLAFALSAHLIDLS